MEDAAFSKDASIMISPVQQQYFESHSQSFLEILLWTQDRWDSLLACQFQEISKFVLGFPNFVEGNQMFSIFLRLTQVRHHSTKHLRVLWSDRRALIIVEGKSRHLDSHIAKGLWCSPDLVKIVWSWSSFWACSANCLDCTQFIVWHESLPRENLSVCISGRDKRRETRICDSSFTWKDKGSIPIWLECFEFVY